MSVLRIIPSVLGLLIGVATVLGVLVYFNYIGFGEYQQYKQVINFAAIVGVMITIVYIGSVVTKLSPASKAYKQKSGTKQVYELERDLMDSAKDYQRFMAKSEDYHILTGARSSNKKHPANHMEQLKENAMFDSVEDFDNPEQAD